MYYLIYLLLLANFHIIYSLEEAEDGSVCFNNCSGHGTCLDYSCTCFTGYFGDDCRYTYADEQDIVPILTSGHFNITRKTFTKTINKHKLILVGFSSYTCHKCIMVEREYRDIALNLTQLNIPFGRADVSKMSSIAKDIGVGELPALFFFKNGKTIPYRGMHRRDSVLAFVNKLNSKPIYKTLKSVDDVNEFLYKFRSDPSHSLATVTVVGFFSEHEDIEEDEYEDFVTAAKVLHHKEDIYVAVVTDPKISRHFIDNKLIDRSPSMMMVGEENTPKTINLDELYGEGVGIDGWIIHNSVPLVAKMIPENFLIYEKIGKPMLLFFLDLEHEMRSAEPGRVIGGRSGNILNEDLLRDFKIVAKEHHSSISFVYLDGNLHKDKMRSLGLFGGKERLPSLAFNTKDGRQIPFSEKLPINSDTLLQFCADFLSGKLKNKADAEEAAKKALLASTPINTRNTATRKQRKKAPKIVTGVSEQFGDGNVGDKSVTTVSLKNFNDIVLDEDKDVLLLLHAKECESCSHLSVYYKRMAQRFQALNIPSLVIARMDVSDESPPPELNLMVAELPIVVLLQASSNQEGSDSNRGKEGPFAFFSGVGKVQVMMKWVQEHAAIPFELPNLPHLDDKQVEMYKTQVREREEALEEKRLKEEQALRDEENEQKKFMKSKLMNDNNNDDGDDNGGEDEDEEIEYVDGDDGVVPTSLEFNVDGISQ